MNRPDHSSSETEPWREALWPRSFSVAQRSTAPDLYLADPSIRKLAEFFERKGLPALKQEDREEHWYEDWINYQAEHRLYASVLAPNSYSSLGAEFDLLRYARFLEVFAYFSPAHGYSLQVSFLGLVSILMGSNDALKTEAVTALEAGELLAFGVSEKNHGSDLFGNEFTVTEAGPGNFVASGTKYYIGNSNSASIISILARKSDGHRDKRAPFVLFALRPKQAKAFGNVRKIRTLGVRAGFVGEFVVKDHELPSSDVLAEGRQAWDAVVGTVTLGKFFLGFGSIGICEHAFEEAVDHLSRRVLYGKAVIEMPHIRAAIAQACARLAAMKLYAYRALDYLRAATPDDRRYLMFCAVQKAKVSTDGVKVMDLLRECIGAKAFESDTYFEMALRDAQLIPNLEGSTHINLGLAAQFMPRYFARPNRSLAEPGSLVAGEVVSKENAYLWEARTGGISTISFPPYLQAYRTLTSVPNVRLFAGQAKSFRLFVWSMRSKRAAAADPQMAMALGQAMATIAYGQLIAENCVRLKLPREIVSTVFHLLITDLSAAAMTLASLSGLDALGRFLIRRLIVIPRTSAAEWDYVSARVVGRCPS
jgi:acyl-CoA dehydrogenase